MSAPARVAVITGAGSGIGRAVAMGLAEEGWSVALFGRRPEALDETVASLSAAARERAWVHAGDVGVRSDVERLAESVSRRFGRVDAVVCAAGANTPRRSWTELTLADYEALMAANLHGAFHCVQVFLAGMKQRRAGSFIFINSEAGRAASAKSGVAYSAAKFGLAGLAQSLNAEERAHGIRAASIFPGDVDTPLLDRRPAPPAAEARARMLQPADVADCVRLILRLPPRAVVEELVIRPA